MCINENDFEFLLPPANAMAMVKADYDIILELEELGGSVEISLQCGEIYSYRKEDMICTIWKNGSVTLNLTEEYFDILFHEIDLIPRNMQICTYDEFYAELDDGMTVWVYDFDSGNICKTGVFYEEDDPEIGMTEQYVLKMLFVAEETEDGNLKCAIASNNVVYCLDDYGSKWAALKEQA